MEKILNPFFSQNIFARQFFFQNTPQPANFFRKSLRSINFFSKNLPHRFFQKKSLLHHFFFGTSPPSLPGARFVNFTPSLTHFWIHCTIPRRLTKSKENMLPKPCLIHLLLLLNSTNQSKNGEKIHRTGFVSMFNLEFVKCLGIVW